VQGYRKLGVQSVHDASSMPLLPLHTLPLLQCGVPPMGSSLLELLQCSCLPWAAIIQELLQSWSPTRSQVLTGACSCMGSPQTTASFRAHPAATSWTSMDCRGISGLTPGEPLPPPSSLPLVSVGIFVSHFHTRFSHQLSYSFFYPFLNMLSQRLYKYH